MGIEFPIPILRPEFEWGETVNASTSFIGAAVTDLVNAGNKTPTVAEILVKAAGLAVDKAKAAPSTKPPESPEQRLNEIRGE